MKYKSYDVFEKFYADIHSSVAILNLPRNKYNQVLKYCRDYQLDFDDGYQLTVANEFGLCLKTQDQDFTKAQKKFEIDIF